MDSETLRRLAAEHTDAAIAQAGEYPYERKAVAEIERRLLEPPAGRHAVVLDAPRRTGKSVALRQLGRRLRAADPSRVVYCDFTDIRLRGVGLQAAIEAFVPRTHDPRLPLFLLLDEVHYCGPEWARELKYGVDNVPARIVVADSAVAVVRSRLREEMVGRVSYVHMHPLSFLEWRALRREIGLPSAPDHDENGMLQECDDYLQLGGFPDHASRRGELQSVHVMLREAVVAQAIRDDVGRLLVARDVESLERLFVSRLAASGAQLSVRDDAKLAQVSEPTVRNWVRAMIDTGLLWALDARVRSAGKYERGQSKLYAVDPSLIGACSLPVFGPADSALLGRQVETAVAQALRIFCQRSTARLSVYQKGPSSSRDGEIDFVVEHGRKLYAIEVTAQQGSKKPATLARVAAELGSSWTAVVSMRSRHESVHVNGQTIHLVPLHEFLLSLAEARPEQWPW